jgi:hypothetical protein
MNIIPPFIPDIKGDDDYKFIDPTLEKEIAEDSQANNFSPIMNKGKHILYNIQFYRIQRLYIFRYQFS